MTIVDEAFSDEEEAFIEDYRPACLAEAAVTPLELSVYVADVLVELDVSVGFTSVGVFEIDVVAVAFFELEVRTGVLDQILMALAGRQESRSQKKMKRTIKCFTF